MTISTNNNMLASCAEAVLPEAENNEDRADDKSIQCHVCIKYLRDMEIKEHVDKKKT